MSGYRGCALVGGTLLGHTEVSLLLLTGTVLVHLQPLQAPLSVPALLLQLPPSDEPPVEGGYEEREDLDAGTDPNIFEPEHLYVVHQTPPTGPLASLGPQKAGGVDDVAEQDGAGDVAEQPEDDELDSQSEGFLLLRHRPEDNHQDWHLSDGHQQRHEEQEDHEGEDHVAGSVAGTLGGHRNLGDLGVGDREVGHVPHTGAVGVVITGEEGGAASMTRTEVGQT